MWRLWIEQYFQVQDYTLWDVIENGNSFKPVAQTINTVGTSKTLVPGHVTTEEKAQNKNDVKARSMLLMALPNEHLLIFNQYKDAKTLFEAMQTRFGGFRRLVSSNNTQISPASIKVSTTSTQIHEDELEEMNLKWQLALLSMRTRKFFQKTDIKITINGSDTAGYDKSKVECFNYHKMGHFARECKGPRNYDNRNKNQDSSRRTINMEETSSKAMVAIDGAGFDWSFMADDEAPTNMALRLSQTMRIEFNKSEFNLATYRRGLTFVEEQLVFYKKNEAMFCEQIAILERDILHKDSKIVFLKGVGFVSYNVVPPPPTGPKTSKSVSKDTFNEVKKTLDAPLVKELVLDDKLEEQTIFPTAAKIEFVRPKQQEKPARKPVRNMFPRTVLMKSVLKPLNTVTPVNTAHPKTTDYSARPMSFNTAKGKVYTARPNAVNTARPNSAVVNAIRENLANAIKASASWVWRPTKLNSASIILKRHNYVDARGRSKVIHKKKIKDMLTVDAQGIWHATCPISQTSRNLMVDMLPLGEEPREEKSLVKELLKLMCDKKNSVLFTNTGCFVLSHDFMLADESQVLLKDPRKNNMYNVDMKNIVPKESLTCLVAKATLNELMLWHRRLGHVKFKTINKLVKENLVRGLPKF
ncbi:ribonuclease H-like domain-containing protein [Tanacetum coccineum]